MAELKWMDLGLTYEEAIHGIQTATKYEQEGPRQSDSGSPKHLRTGINVAMSDHAALAYLLIEKGIVTLDEYKEALRKAANHELWRHEQDNKPLTFR